MTSEDELLNNLISSPIAKIPAQFESLTSMARQHNDYCHKVFLSFLRFASYIFIFTPDRWDKDSVP